MDANRYDITDRVVVFEAISVLARLSDLVTLSLGLLARSAGHHREFLNVVLLYALYTLRHLRVYLVHSAF